MFRKFSTIVFFSTALFGCTNLQEYKIKSVPNTDQLQSYDKPGTGIIEGNALLKQAGGGVVTCAGNITEIFPSIDYSDEIMRAFSSGHYVNPDSYYNDFKQKYMKQTTCDSMGNFIFDSLPAGNYWITTTVVWVVGYNQQGGAMAQKITLKSGEKKKIVLSSSDVFRVAR